VMEVISDDFGSCAVMARACLSRQRGMCVRVCEMVSVLGWCFFFGDWRRRSRAAAHRARPFGGTHALGCRPLVRARVSKIIFHGTHFQVASNDTGRPPRLSTGPRPLSLSSPPAVVSSVVVRVHIEMSTSSARIREPTAATIHSQHAAVKD
jgi:hypothetical protein